MPSELMRTLKIAALRFGLWAWDWAWIVPSWFGDLWTDVWHIVMYPMRDALRRLEKNDAE